MVKTLILLIIGCFGGLWLAWPGVTKKKNWICVKEIVVNSQNNKIDVRTLKSVTPKYLVNRNKLTNIDRLRYLGDTCFR